ncbi:MAG: ABC transporter ATP-binding protein [Coriobacteriales bacterium]|jgi:iron complex transport system ATP-binding protein|nr:ABC transporter ATP-binding protein [Coriobacteriales bacterium]
MSEEVISLEAVSFAYHRDAPVLADVGLAVASGEVLVLLGPNGSGKTSLLNCMAGLLHPQEGTVRLCGRDIRSMGMRDIALKLGYLPQLQTVSFEFNVLDYVVMGRAPHLRFGKSPVHSDYRHAEQVLDRLGIARLAESPMDRISGGERQLAQIARILMQEAPLILMDEPTNHLDYGNQIRALRLIKEMAAEGFAVILTSHVPDHAIWLRSTVGAIRRRGPLVTGRAEEVLNESLLSELYQENISLHYLADRGHCICVPELSELVNGVEHVSKDRTEERKC